MPRHGGGSRRRAGDSQPRPSGSLRSAARQCRSDGASAVAPGAPQI